MSLTKPGIPFLRWDEALKKPHVLFIVENSSVPGDYRVPIEAKALHECGYEVSIICPDSKHGKRGISVMEGIHVYRHPQATEANGRLAMIREYLNAVAWEVFLSLRIFLSHPFQVIHGANPPDHLFLISLPFRLLGVKYVFDHHDLTPETYVAKFGRKDLLHGLLLFMERLSFKAADLVVASNGSYKEVALRRGSKKDEDVVVVRNGPTLNALHDTHPNPGLREGFNYMVAYMGAIGQQDQVENIIRVADNVVHEKGRTDIKFVIVGPGPSLPSVVKLCHDLGLDRYVQFTGYIPPSKALYEILATADVCVNPEYRNAYTDKSTMIKTMEYMAVRKPIIQFYTVEGDYSAGEAAVSIPESSTTRFADVLLELLADPQRRLRMGSSGRKRVEDELEWPKQKVLLQRAYRRLFSDRIRGRTGFS